MNVGEEREEREESGVCHYWLDWSGDITVENCQILVEIEHLTGL